MKTSEKIKNFNESTYSTNWNLNFYGRKRIKKILDMLGSNKKVLDIGCYDGTIAKYIESKGNKVIGFDISSKAVKLAKIKGIEAYQVNIEEGKLPKKMGKFDAVVAGEIIEHMFDTDEFLKKINSLLKRDGNLILTTPNLAGLGSRLSLLMGKKPWMIENSIKGVQAGHIRYFTIEELSKILADNGFKPVEISTDCIGLGKRFNIPFIDRFFPSLGRVLIVKARKV